MQTCDQHMDPIKPPLKKTPVVASCARPCCICAADSVDSRRGTQKGELKCEGVPGQINNCPCLICGGCWHTVSTTCVCCSYDSDDDS